MFIMLLHVLCIQLLTSYVSADWIEESAAFSSSKISRSVKVVDSIPHTKTRLIK